MSLSQDEHDANTIIVATVEEYAHKHDMSTSAVIALFREGDMFSLLRSQYEVLHTLDLSEGAAFAEDVLRSHHA